LNGINDNSNGSVIQWLETLSNTGLMW
jgi:hypothetical protein